MPTGTVKIQARARGFKRSVYSSTPYDANQPSQHAISLNVAAATETIEFTAAAPLIQTTTSQVPRTFSNLNGPAGSSGGAREADGKNAHAPRAAVNALHLA